MNRDGARAWIGLGSNLGDRRAHLEDSVVEIAALPGVHLGRVSRWFETDAEGGPRGQPRFLNGALWLDATCSAHELFEGLQAIERAHGRDRSREVRDGPRTLDLDLLLYGGAVIEGPELRIPHPRLEERWFVLAPIADLAPDLVLPGCGRTVAARLAELRSSRDRPPHRSNA
jgi:2-amino-4-hydroxy-6-hydroxymethyldihydropteridine diphosphokinase